MPRRAVLCVALALAALGAVGAPVPGAGAGRYANPQLLIETDEVARMLGASGVRFVDVRSGMMGGVAYRVGHVPGAFHLDAGELDDPGPP
jgi:hypothetical protein